MKLFSNREIKRFTVGFCVICAVTCALGAAFYGPYCAVFVFAAFCAAYALYISSVSFRYRELRRMSDSLNRVLHGEDGVFITESREGELSVLQSEISKMTVRLREAADNMKKDKLFLSDAMADISHQLRTPLTSINIILSTLSLPELDEGRRREHVTTLRRLCSRIDWLVETLLKISKIDAGTAVFERAEIKASELVRRAVEPLEASLDLHEIELCGKTDGAYFTGDISWSAEAVCNIIKNCIEHTPCGGKIEVRARTTPVFTEITVKDSGCGFDEADIPHLFERFYRGKNSAGEGVGIGLALAKSIVERQNGTIKAENAPGGGALFTVRFYLGVV